MDAFSYLSVLLSIILGLAITQILQGYRGLLLARGRVTFYVPSLIWTALNCRNVQFSCFTSPKLDHQAWAAITNSSADQIIVGA